MTANFNSSDTSAISEALPYLRQAHEAHDIESRQMALQRFTKALGIDTQASLYRTVQRGTNDDPVREAMGVFLAIVLAETLVLGFLFSDGSEID